MPWREQFTLDNIRMSPLCTRHTRFIGYL